MHLARLVSLDPETFRGAGTDLCVALPTDGAALDVLPLNTEDAAHRAVLAAEVAVLEAAHAARRARGRVPSPDGVRRLAVLRAALAGAVPPPPAPGAHHGGSRLATLATLSAALCVGMPTYAGPRYPPPPSPLQIASQRRRGR
jgi:hypothetical protein